MTEYHDIIKPFRLQKRFLKAIEKVVRRNPELYGSVSHFIRVSVIKLLRDHKVLPAEQEVKSFEIKKTRVR